MKKDNITLEDIITKAKIKLIPLQGLVKKVKVDEFDDDIHLKIFEDGTFSEEVIVVDRKKLGDDLDDLDLDDVDLDDFIQHYFGILSDINIPSAEELDKKILSHRTDNRTDSIGDTANKEFLIRELEGIRVYINELQQLRIGYDNERLKYENERLKYRPDTSEDDGNISVSSFGSYQGDLDDYGPRRELEDYDNASYDPSIFLELQRDFLKKIKHFNFEYLNWSDQNEIDSINREDHENYQNYLNEYGYLALNKKHREKAATDIQRVVRGYGIRKRKISDKTLTAGENQIFSDADGDLTIPEYLKHKKSSNIDPEISQDTDNEEKFISGDHDRIQPEDEEALKTGHMSQSEMTNATAEFKKPAARTFFEGPAKSSLKPTKFTGLFQESNQNKPYQFYADGTPITLDFTSHQNKSPFERLQDQISDEYEAGDGYLAAPYPAASGDGVIEQALLVRLDDKKINKDKKDIFNPQHALVLKSKNSVETIYLDGQTYQNLVDKNKNTFAYLIEVRKSQLRYQKFFDECDENQKKDIHQEFLKAFKGALLSDSAKEDFKGINHLLNHMDELVNQGDVKQLKKLSNLFFKFLKNIIEGPKNETIKKQYLDQEKHVQDVDNFYKNRLNIALNNDFYKKQIDKANKQRKVTQFAIGLSDQEKKNLISAFIPRYLPGQNIVKENVLDHLLNNAELPICSEEPAIAFRRFKPSPFNNNNWLFRQTSQETEFVTVMFKGEAHDNIMYLAIKGTDYHVRVMRKENSTEIEIDNSKLYKRNAKDGFYGTDIDAIERGVTNGAIHDRNLNIRKKFNQFGIFAISEIDGQRSCAVMHNGRVHGQDLQSVAAASISSSPISLDNEFLDLSKIEPKSPETVSHAEETTQTEINKYRNKHGNFDYAISAQVVSDSGLEGYIVQRVSGQDTATTECPVHIEQFQVPITMMEDFQQRMAELNESLDNFIIEEQDFRNQKQMLMNSFDEQILRINLAQEQRGDQRIFSGSNITLQNKADEITIANTRINIDDAHNVYQKIYLRDVNLLQDSRVIEVATSNQRDETNPRHSPEQDARSIGRDIVRGNMATKIDQGGNNPTTFAPHLFARRSRGNPNSRSSGNANTK